MTALSPNVDREYFVCLPSCHRWKKLNQHTVIDPKSTKIYGRYTKDTHKSLRMKFIVLGIFQGFYGMLFRLPYRICTLISGDFFKAGYRKAKREWKVERQVWSIKNPNKHLPGRISLLAKTSKHAFVELTKNIIKIVTFPLALIALEFSALYGLINPLEGRVLYGKIEHAWTRNEIVYSHNLQGHFQLRLSDYIAPCMLNSTVAKPLLPNLIRDYHPLTLRSLIGRTEKHLILNRIFFENEKINVNDMLMHLGLYQSNITKYSYIDSSEFDMKGNIKHNLEQTSIAKKLKDILSNLEDILNTRECIIETLIRAGNPGKLKNVLVDCHTTININLTFLDTVFLRNNSAPLKRI